MSDIGSLLEEYTHLTGRPLATISVDEYLALKRFEALSSVTVETKVSHVQPDKPKQTEEAKAPAPVQKTSNIKQLSTVKTEERREKTQSSKADALSILRSIPG